METECLNHESLMSCYVTGTGSVNLKNEKKNCRQKGFFDPFKNACNSKKPLLAFFLFTFFRFTGKFFRNCCFNDFSQNLSLPCKKNNKNKQTNKEWLHPHSLPLLFSPTAKKSKVTKKRATRLSAVQMLEKKNSRKADLKEKELKLKYEELKLQNKKFEQEAAERNERLKLELEEKKSVSAVLKGKDVELP